VKPIFGDDSLGVSKLDHGSDISNVISECRSTWSRHRDAFKNFPDVWLLEEYMPGRLVSVDGIIHDGRVQFAGLVEIGMEPEPHFTQSANWLPARVSSEGSSACFAFTQRVIAALEFDNCGFHCELRLGECDVPSLIEISARLPGGLIPEAYARAYGLDLAGSMLDIWMGRTAELRRTRQMFITQKGVFPNGNGVVTAVTGIEEARLIPGVWHASVITSPREPVVTYPHVPKPLYLYSVEASSAAEREARERQIERTVKVDVK